MSVVSLHSDSLRSLYSRMFQQPRLELEHTHPLPASSLTSIDSQSSASDAFEVVQRSEGTITIHMDEVSTTLPQRVIQPDISE